MAESDDDETGGPSLSPEVIASYLKFGKRSIRARWWVSLLVLGAGLLFTLALALYLPRTYQCQTALMSVGNPALDGRDVGNPFAGASDLIIRHENLEGLIHDLDLVTKYEQRRPKLLKLKDSLTRRLFGDLSEEIKIAILVATIQSRMEISTDKGDLTITVDWSDAKTAAELAEAARESFLKARRTAEIAAFEEKMSILEGHSKKLREEIETLAAQADASRAAKLQKARDEQAAARSAARADAPPPVRMLAPRRSKPSGEPDPSLALLKDQLQNSRRKLAELEGDRERRLREEQNKFEELKLRLTASHPQVITQGERVAMLEQIPSDIALLRAEVKDLEDEIRQGEAMARTANDASAPGHQLLVGGGGTATAEPLPPNITELLGQNDLDPALGAQLSSEVMKYGALRDEILSAQIQLDTAQAAFNHRYQVIIPAEVPDKPTKPKRAVVLGGGAFVSLLLALLVPILIQLRRGIMIELWQVQQVNLPVLAELKLPPHSGE